MLWKSRFCPTLCGQKTQLDAVYESPCIISRAVLALRMLLDLRHGPAVVPSSASDSVQVKHPISSVFCFRNSRYSCPWERMGFLIGTRGGGSKATLRKCCHPIDGARTPAWTIIPPPPPRKCSISTTWEVGEDT